MKNFFVLTIFLVFLTSVVGAVTVTDTSPVTVTDTTNAQSFAQINAKITELANQIGSLRAQNETFFAGVMKTSDLNILYENQVRINQLAEQQLVIDILVVIVLAFAIMFILIGKNMIPQNKPLKKEKEVKNVPVELEILAPEPEVVIPSQEGGA